MPASATEPRTRLFQGVTLDPFGLKRGHRQRTSTRRSVSSRPGGLLGAGGGHASDSALRAAAAWAPGAGSGAWSWRE